MSVARATNTPDEELAFEFVGAGPEEAYELAVAEHKRHLDTAASKDTRGNRLLEGAVAAGLADRVPQIVIAKDLEISKATASRVAKALGIRHAYPTETRSMTWVQLCELPCPLKDPDLLASLLRDPAVQTMSRDRIRQLRPKRSRALEPHNRRARAGDGVAAKWRRFGHDIRRSASDPRALRRILRAARDDPELSVAFAPLNEGGRRK
jgi:hypothetical protein